MINFSELLFTYYKLLAQGYEKEANSQLNYIMDSSLNISLSEKEENIINFIKVIDDPLIDIDLRISSYYEFIEVADNFDDMIAFSLIFLDLIKLLYENKKPYSDNLINLKSRQLELKFVNTEVYDYIDGNLSLILAQKSIDEKNFDEAIVFLQESLSQFKHHELTYLIAVSYYKLALVSLEIHQEQLALDYMNKILELPHGEELKIKVSNILNNMISDEQQNYANEQILMNNEIPNVTHNNNLETAEKDIQMAITSDYTTKSEITQENSEPEMDTDHFIENQLQQKESDGSLNSAESEIQEQIKENMKDGNYSTEIFNDNQGESKKEQDDVYLEDTKNELNQIESSTISFDDSNLNHNENEEKSEDLEVDEGIKSIYRNLNINYDQDTMNMDSPGIDVSESNLQDEDKQIETTSNELSEDDDLEEDPEREKLFEALFNLNNINSNEDYSEEEDKEIDNSLIEDNLKTALDKIDDIDLNATEKTYIEYTEYKGVKEALENHENKLNEGLISIEEYKQLETRFDELSMQYNSLITKFNTLEKNFIEINGRYHSLIRLLKKLLFVEKSKINQQNEFLNQLAGEIITEDIRSAERVVDQDNEISENDLFQILGQDQGEFKDPYDTQRKNEITTMSNKLNDLLNSDKMIDRIYKIVLKEKEIRLRLLSMIVGVNPFRVRSALDELLKLNVIKIVLDGDNPLIISK